MIAVLGAGAVSNFGIGVQAFREGVTGSGPIPPAVPAFEITDYVPLKTQCLDLTSGMALVAAGLALQEARTTQPQENPARIGLILGTAYGNAHVLAEYAVLAKPSPLRFVHGFINASAGLVCQVLKIYGPHVLLCSGPVAGIQALRYATWMLAEGRADIVLCGGVDSWVPGRRPGMGVGAGLLALGSGSTLAPGSVRLAGYAQALDAAPEVRLERALQKAAARGACTVADLDVVVLGSVTDTARSRQVFPPPGLDLWRSIDLGARIRFTGAGQGALALVLAYAEVRAFSGSGSAYRVAATFLDEKTCTCVIFDKGSEL